MLEKQKKKLEALRARLRSEVELLPTAALFRWNRCCARSWTLFGVLGRARPR